MRAAACMWGGAGEGLGLGLCGILHILFTYAYNVVNT